MINGHDGVDMRANQLKTISECAKAIEAIEMNPKSVIGGNNAFFSGKRTYLTESAKRKVEALNRQMEKLGGDCDE